MRAQTCHQMVTTETLFIPNKLFHVVSRYKPQTSLGLYVRDQHKVNDTSCRAKSDKCGTHLHSSPLNFYSSIKSNTISCLTELLYIYVIIEELHPWEMILPPPCSTSRLELPQLVDLICKSQRAALLTTNTLNDTIYFSKLCFSLKTAAITFAALRPSGSAAGSREKLKQHHRAGQYIDFIY